MGWFDENGYHGPNGGVSGGRPYQVSGRPAPGTNVHDMTGAVNEFGEPINSPEAIARINHEHPEYSGGAPAFDPSQQVGHNGSINGMSREQYRDAWQGSGITNNQGLDSWLAQHGGHRVNDSGVVMTPFGEQIDMGQGFKSGNGHAAWGGMDGGGGPPGGGPHGAGAGGGVPLSALGAGGGGGYSSSGGLTVGQAGHLGGHFDPYQYENFTAPDPSQIANDPAYKFRMDQAMGRIQASAASKGMLGDFKTLKALNAEAQGQASQEYQNVYGRALQTNQANNQGRLSGFTANTNADLGYGNLDVANRNVDLGYTRAGNDYALGQGQLGLGYHTANQNYALGQGQQSLGWANYGLNADQQRFGQGFSLAQLGLQAAGQAGSYGSQYSNAGGGYMTGAGNARAAGYAGAGAAYGGAMSNFGNMAMGYGMYQGMNR